MFSRAIRRIAPRTPVARRGLATQPMPHQQHTATARFFEQEHRLATVLVGSAVAATVIVNAPANEHDDLDCQSYCYACVDADSLGQ